MALGVAAFCVLEGLSPVQAFYVVCVSMTTVGFGDVVGQGAAAAPQAVGAVGRAAGTHLGDHHWRPQHGRPLLWSLPPPWLPACVTDRMCLRSVL
eukprot:273276-Chlamydomonas_euryale.AAC.1